MIYKATNKPGKELYISGVRRTFRTSSYPEYMRIQNLMGEKSLIQDLLSELKPSDDFFDIGANVGLYSCFADGFITDGSITTFEPHPNNIESLRLNVQNNEVDAQIHELALSDSEGEGILIESGSDAGEGAHQLSSVEGGDGLRIEINTMDNIVSREKVPQPSVVKLDVEGSELGVLRGGTEVLNQDRCRMLYCEVHPSKFDEPYQTVIDLLKDFGFDIKIVNGEFGGYSTIKATK